jgi:hypothetical protein
VRPLETSTWITFTYALLLFDLAACLQGALPSAHKERGFEHKQAVRSTMQKGDAEKGEMKRSNAVLIWEAWLCQGSGNWNVGLNKGSGNFSNEDSPEDGDDDSTPGARNKRQAKAKRNARQQDQNKQVRTACWPLQRESTMSWM